MDQINSDPSPQSLVTATLNRVFGAPNVSNRNERLKRFLEEAVELVRVGGLTDNEIKAVVAYEIGRPVGPDVNQELGGAGVTLYAVAAAFGQNLDTCVSIEIEQIDANMAKCRAKHATKPAAVLSASSVPQ